MRETLPVIPDAHLEAMIASTKPVPDTNWRDQLRPTIRNGANLVGQYELPHQIDFGPVRGELRLCSRVTVADPLHFSVILAFRDLAGHDYRLVRLNGHHGPHVNRLEGTRIAAATPHIHTATERYLAARNTKHDGFAEESDAYGDVESAIDHLQTLVSLQPEGQMFL